MVGKMTGAKRHTGGITRHYLLAAGGTGGHMMPAYALAGELIARGHRVALISDDRGVRFGTPPDGLDVHILPAGRPGGGILGHARAARGIWRGRAQAIELARSFAPSAVIGFGGYPALPALLAARKLGIRALVHEQNAVLGRVNRLVARQVAAIATAYKNVARIPAAAASRVALVGNPVREEILALRAEPFPAVDGDGIFRLLITGGSQAASVFADVVPEALSLLPLHFRQRLQVTQHCRAEDVERVRAQYQSFGIPADISTFINDMAEKLHWSHLVIARAGASTIAELTCVGRPAILVPLPSAMDDHQSHNVREMVEAGGARAIAQDKFTPVELAKQMQKLAMEPEALLSAAARARSVGRPDATRDLADLVEQGGGAPLADVLGASAKRAPRARLAGAAS